MIQKNRFESNRSTKVVSPDKVKDLISHWIWGCVRASPRARRHIVRRNTSQTRVLKASALCENRTLTLWYMYDGCRMWKCNGVFGDFAWHCDGPLRRSTDDQQVPRDINSSDNRVASSREASLQFDASVKSRMRCEWASQRFQAIRGRVREDVSIAKTWHERW